MTDLFIKVKIHQQQQLPFVLFCKPNSDKVIGLFQKNNQLHFLENFDEKGFVFAPFDGEEMIIIPQNQSDVIVDRKVFTDFYLENKVKIPKDLDGQFDFETLVSAGIKHINDGHFQKVVLSRKELIELDSFDIETVFKKLIAFYPTAFSYCFYHPKVGLWMGATPEQFVKINEQEFQTVSLAGTQLNENSKDVIWTKKELVEQQIVTDYIVNNIRDLVVKMVVTSPYTTQAGTINHIKTDITATISDACSIKEIILRLHPTPAVCGFPTQKAKDFILQNENYNREFYSGFLGEWNIDLATFRTQQTDLFVNLRCMKIETASKLGLTKAELFMGCGVIKDSSPSSEYIETVNKSMTMKRCIL